MVKSELLATWTRLKPKLEKLTSLLKHKGLIKEAVEFHRDQFDAFQRIVIPPSGTREAQVYHNQQRENKRRIRECNELLRKLD